MPSVPVAHRSGHAARPHHRTAEHKALETGSSKAVLSSSPSRTEWCCQDKTRQRGTLKTIVPDLV